MWTSIRALIIKEILAVWHDKKSRISLIAPPVIQLLILSHAATLEVQHISIAVFNQDNGRYSREIVERLQGSHYFDHVYGVHSASELKHAIDVQKALVALQFQPDFSRRVSAGGGSAQLIVDGRKSNSGQIVAGYVSRIIGDFNAEIQASRGLGTGPPVVTVFRAWFNPNLDYIIYNVPCLVAVLSMMLGIMVTALSVAREREMGTFDQLLVSPLQPWQILVGKAIPAMIIGVGETTFIMLLAIVVFGIPFTGSLLLFYGSMGGFRHVHHRGGAVHLLGGAYAAAGAPGCVRVHDADDDHVGLFDAGGKHGLVAKARERDDAAAALSGYRERIVPQGHIRC